MTIFQKLNKIQTELKAPKGQTNNFGHYKYRSCEDILEAIKPLLKELEAIIIMSDKMVQLGERYYVKATVTLQDVKSEQHIKATASARESLVKKGMDESQITGTASSYARKYALNGLFLIGDTKDTDTQDNSGSPKQQFKPAKAPATKVSPKATEQAQTSLQKMKLKLFEDGATSDEEAVKLISDKAGVTVKSIAEVDEKMAKEIMDLYNK